MVLKVSGRGRRGALQQFKGPASLVFSLHAPLPLRVLTLDILLAVFVGPVSVSYVDEYVIFFLPSRVEGTPYEGFPWSLDREP